jgi:hypothetical protein
LSLYYLLDKRTEFKKCVDIAVNVEGVEMPVTAYVTGNGVTYDLLLSRRWLEGVGAQEDYKNKTFSINQDRVQIVVRLTLLDIRRKMNKPELDTGPGLGANTQEKLEQEWAEDIIEELEDELNEGKE